MGKEKKNRKNTVLPGLSTITASDSGWSWSLTDDCLLTSSVEHTWKVFSCPEEGRSVNTGNSSCISVTLPRGKKRSEGTKKYKRSQAHCLYSYLHKPWVWIYSQFWFYFPFMTWHCWLVWWIQHSFYPFKGRDRYFAMLFTSTTEP